MSDPVALLLLLVGITGFFLAIFSATLERWATLPVFALALGIVLRALGVGAARFFHGIDATAFFEQFTRITLAIGLMDAALRLDVRRLEWKPALVFLGLMMVLMWGATAAIVWLLFPAGGLAPALLVGAVLTPTDPVLAGTIVSGRLAERNVPARLRRLLSFESAANDGLAYPFVFVGLAAVAAVRGWRQVVMDRVLLDVIVLSMLGAVSGLLAGRLLSAATRHGTSDKPGLLAQTTGLALFVLGGARLLHMDAILGVFVAGLVFSAVVDRRVALRGSEAQQAHRLFTLPLFALVGLALPWHAWAALGWRAVVLPLAVLLFRRIPALFAVSRLIPAISGAKDRWFTGWFGPIGASALFYATLATRETGRPELWAVTTLVVFSSILAHGLTAPVLTRLYGRRAHDNSHA